MQLIKDNLQSRNKEFQMQLKLAFKTVEQQQMVEENQNKILNRYVSIKVLSLNRPQSSSRLLKSSSSVKRLG